MHGLRSLAHLRLFLVISLLTVSCSGLHLPGLILTPAPTATGTPTATAALPAPGSTRTPAGPTILRVWVPPQFDPSAGTPAANLLQARLEEYAAQRLDVRVEVRVKATDGPGGLLDALSSANAAAPLALPDLVLLSRGQLETAALKGLLFPIDGLTVWLEAEDWFSFAQQLARVQNSTFGLPFAGDALILLYRAAEVDTPPRNWSAALETAQPLAFPAADLEALFTLAQYQSTGARTQDDEGRPVLEEAPLAEVLTFYLDGEAAGLLPVWLTQLTTDDEAWQAYVDARASMVITWTSRYLGTLPGDTSAELMFTREGTTFTLTDGWVWALSNPQSDRHSLSIDLAEFLTEGEFLAGWTANSGYLPPRGDALSGWSNASLRGLAQRIAASAVILPSNDVLAAVGPALQEAVLNVLRQQSDPETAAREAAERLGGP